MTLSVRACVCAQVSASERVSVRARRGGQLEECCWTTVLDLLTNHLKSGQAGASLRV